MLSRIVLTAGDAACLGSIRLIGSPHLFVYSYLFYETVVRANARHLIEIGRGSPR